jgi:hypothetical protein
LFLEKIIFKDKKLFLGIKSGAKIEPNETARVKLIAQPVV